jgi:DNA-binding MarR family transcriptional regulator
VTSLEQIIIDRSRRAMHFPGELFADPAWDILLDLALAAERHDRLSVTDTCIGSGVPTTTALRYIALLESKGLIDRRPDQGDRRRFWLALSEAGRAAMQAYLAPPAVRRAA